VPPLRRRRSDIPLLIEHFVQQAAPGVRFRLSANVLESLLLDPWPRNVRELKALCGRLALARPEGGELRSGDLAAEAPPVSLAPAAPRKAAAETAARSRPELSELLRTHAGNVVKQVYRWLELRGLDPRDFRG
jgi:DNA-binding NtrC family response regulator